MSSDLEKELSAALKGPGPLTKLLTTARGILEPLGCYFSIPPYQPDNQDWETTFKALGLNYKDVNKFHGVFYKMNKSHDGEVSIIEFMNFFDLNRTQYVAKAFEYCDTVGGGEMDFLEFVVSVTNFCMLKPNTLTDFTFDLYDLDGDGEMSYDEIETMVKELYGAQYTTSIVAKQCLEDLAVLCEKCGGGIPQKQFVNFHFQHQTLLFPAFIVQRTVQEKIFGLAFWKGKSNENPAKAIKHGERRFDRRHVQSILRTYKTGSAAAILTHTGDPNEGLREWMEKAKNPEAVDPEAVRKEIEARRGSKLTLIAEWRRRVNPKKREEYKQQLLVDAKARREREKREKEEKKKLQELMNDKKNQEYEEYKQKVICMIVDGETLNDGEIALAVEHDLYAVAIAVAEEAALRKAEEDAAEEVRMIEVERVRDEMIMARGENDEVPELNEEKKLLGMTEEEDAIVPVVVTKKEKPKGSNGRPKVARKGRRKDGDGRWADRLPPIESAPEGQPAVDKPTELFDGRGKKLKTNKSARDSKRTSRSGSPTMDLDGGSRRLSMSSPGMSRPMSPGMNRAWSRRGSTIGISVAEEE